MEKISFLSRFLDIIAPRRCVACHRRLMPNEEEICLSCLNKLTRTLFWKHPQSNGLADSLYEHVEVEKAASWVFYVGRCKEAVHSLKYKGRDMAAFFFGKCMAQEIKDSGFFDDIDVIMPVPLSSNRLYQRGYNQSLAIAKGISQKTNIVVVDNVLKRKRFKQSQTKLTSYERKINVENQFYVENTSRIIGKHILIVDDVITTGATISSCISPLYKVEGVKVSVISLAFAGL